jgi:cobaltochelatase CobS
MNQLTPKQQAFVDAILAGNHPNEAARKAGYKYAAQAALTLSKTPAVMSAIEQGQKKSSGIIQNEQARKEEAIMEEAQIEERAPARGTDALRTALREIIGDTLDEKRVTEIVRQIVKQEAGLAPVRVEVVTPAGKTFDCGTQHRQFSKLMTKLLAGRNVYLAGPAGTGKTTAARNAAEMLSKTLGREIPFYFNGAIDSEHKLLGFTDAQGRVVSRPFRKAFTEGGVYLFDEVDASLAGALLAFNAALSNDTCDFPDGCLQKHPDFRCIAAANTWGFGATHDYVGRAKLDEAFRDRFVMLKWDTDEALERRIALNHIEDENLGSRWITHVQQCRANASRAGVRCVISPRASINGCALLQAGEEWSEVEESCIRKGMAEESWKQIVA